MSETVSIDELFFFDAKPTALPLYEAFRESVVARWPDTRIEVKKTQISFFDRRMFAAVSFTPVRRAKDRPDPFLTITFGLPTGRNRYGSLWLLNLIQTGGRIT